MPYEIQKASLWKRFAASILDIILVVIIVTGMFSLLAGVFGLDGYQKKAEQVVNRYLEKYQLNADMTQEEFDALPEEEQQAYNERVAAADAELQNTPADLKTCTDVVSVILLILTVGILVAMLLLEFVVPLLLKNGQTIGKKVFSLALVRVDSVKISPLQLFIRAVISRYALETMIPVYVAGMYLLLGYTNLFSLILLGALAIVQIAALIITKNNCLLHDLMSGTVVVDYSCQMIFSNREERQAYQEKVEADKKNRVATY